MIKFSCTLLCIVFAVNSFAKDCPGSVSYQEFAHMDLEQLVQLRLGSKWSELRKYLKKNDLEYLKSKSKGYEKDVFDEVVGSFQINDLPVSFAIRDNRVIGVAQYVNQNIDEAEAEEIAADFSRFLRWRFGSVKEGGVIPIRTRIAYIGPVEITKAVGSGDNRVSFDLVINRIPGKDTFAVMAVQILNSTVDQ